MQPENERSEDELRFENELKRIKLGLEHGMTFSKPEDSDHLPPEVENDFLSYVDQFEKGYADAKAVSVFEFVGKPVFLKAETIPDDNISRELKKVLDVLEENEVVIDTICEVEERELYRFITDELMLVEMDDMRVPGMKHHFIYEEFHPNHEYDIRNHCSDFFRGFLKKESNYFETFLTSEAIIIKDLMSFREAYDSFGIESFEITSLNIDALHATVHYDADFSGKKEGARETHRFKGVGIFELQYEYEFWAVGKVIWPRISE